LSLLDLDAVHVYQFAEWVDGIKALSQSGGPAMTHKESLDKIKVGLSRLGATCCLMSQILAEVALKVRLLDITGDGVELPEKVAIGQGKLFPERYPKHS
jgi:hypothetical protein